MIAAALALLALCATLFQLGAIPALLIEPGAAPLLPIALLAAWSAVRDPAEGAPALIVVAVTLGVASQERAGWFLLALVPAAAFGLLASRLAGPRRVAGAAVAAGGGAAAYLALLLLAGGRAATIPFEAGTIAAAALWTAACAGVLIMAMWPLRRRPAGLFD